MTFLALLFFAQDLNAQAMEYVRQARDTADPAYHAKAEQAIAKSLEAAPENFEGLKAKTWLLLGQHRFAEALEFARKLNRRVPDDLQVYGFLVDASVELGAYAEGEQAAQWMLDLRPGNAPGLTRAAYLREIYKDYDGALQLMQQAFNRTRPEEKGDRAWILAHIGRILCRKQEYAKAELALKASLDTYPNYHYALANLAECYKSQKKFAEAAVLYRIRYDNAPHPENLYDLGDALSKAGKIEEARVVFANFEAAALAESDKADNANRELALYYLQHAKKPADGLRIAQIEAARRRDVHTLEVLAEALGSNGMPNEAERALAEAKQRIASKM